MPEMGDSSGRGAGDKCIRRTMRDKTNQTNADITLGQRLRAYRKEKGMTLADMSKITGFAISTLSKIENGKIALNFSTVLSLSERLAVPIVRFIGPTEDQKPTGRRAITRSGRGHKTSYPRWDLETLCDDFIQKRNVFWKMTVKCRDIQEHGPLAGHPGEEFLYIITGAIELHTDLYKPLLLQAGDSILFDAMTPHGYIAVSEEDPLVLMSNTVTSQPIKGFASES